MIGGYVNCDCGQQYRRTVHNQCPGCGKDAKVVGGMLTGADE